ncbi:hypothetical protein [Paenibacillus polymyxa]|uniref:hypothetical protein n=1 Tax=Paenibacillus polymyxa TaxID=1406 RepID=UPI002ED6BE88
MFQLLMKCGVPKSMIFDMPHRGGSGSELEGGTSFSSIMRLGIGDAHPLLDYEQDLSRYEKWYFCMTVN